MVKHKEQEYLELLHSAMETPFGIEIKTNDAENLRARLYVLRRQYIQFKCLSMILSPKNLKDLWIVRKPEEDFNGEEN